MPSHQPCIQFCDINGYGFFSKLTKLYVVNVCFMDDCAGGGGGGGGEWEDVGSGDVLFWSLPGCVHATLLSTTSCNFLNCYLFTTKLRSS